MRNALRDAGIAAATRWTTSTPTAPPPKSATAPRPRPSSAAFGEHAYKVAVSSTKSMTGHLLGGAGGLEAGITVLALRDQIAPPTINLRESRSGLRSGLRAQPGAADEDRLRALQLLRLRRHQRLL